MPSPPLAFLTLPWLLATPVEHPPEPWTPGERIERAIAPGEVRRHLVTLEAGQFVRVTVVQSGVDVVVRRVGPDGKVGPDVDASEGPRGVELCSILAGSSGGYAIEVKGHTEAPAAGHYVLDSDPVRTADARDRRRLVGEEARARSAPGLGPRAVYSMRGQPSGQSQAEALRQLPIAAEVFRDLGETCLEAESLTFDALIRGWGGYHAEVLRLHARALELWERCGDRYKHAEAHIYAGEGYRRAAQYGNAVAIYERGLAMARELGARDLALLLLVNMATSYNPLGEVSRAMECYQEALPLLRAGGLKQGEGVALRGLGLSHMRQGDYQGAADRLLESLEVRRGIGDRPGVITALVSLGEIYVRLGEPATARSYLDEAVAFAAGDYSNSGGWGRIATELAKAYELEGDRVRARAYFEEALAFSQRPTSREYEPQSLLLLGRFLFRGRDFDAAWEAASEAAGLLRESGARAGLADALELQGAVWLERRDAARARAALEESLTVRRQMEDGPGQATALHGLARVDLASGQVDQARQRLEEALRLVEGVRARIVSPDLRSTWMATVRAIHDTHVDALMELHRLDPSGAWSVKAFEASESARARSLLDLLAEAHAAIRTDVEPERLKQERSLRERLSARIERQLRLSAGAPELEELKREIASLSAEYEELTARLRAASPRYAALTQPKILGLDEIRSQVLDDDTVLLEYGLGAERSRLWVVGRDRFEVHELAKPAEIEAAVLSARKAVGSRGSSAGASLAALSRLLLPPALERLAGRRLVFVADGSLHHVPFAALRDARGRPLVATHEVVTAPSASVIAQLRRVEAGRERAPRTLAVLADPVFDRQDSRLHARAATPPRPDATLERATRDFGFEGSRLPRLIFTRREAQSIFALAPVGSRRMALDFQASRATVEEPDLGQYRYLHFATHGLLNDVRPDLSGLVLSLVDKEGRETPGLLTAPDVFNLDLGAELVVLSGCRTALGKEIRGEGLIGLTRAFMYAGAPRVVASLWPVDDLTTARLMKHFYEGMLGPQQLRPAAALRRAQAKMARDPHWSAPYYWAAFQLQGDWR